MDVLFIPLCASVGEEGPAMNYRERGRRNLSGRTAEGKRRKEKGYDIFRFHNFSNSYISSLCTRIKEVP